MTGAKMTVRPGLKVREAVIPAAGFGTWLFPDTKAAKKELFPIIDRDGIANPAILLIVEEVLVAGIKEVVIIVQEDDYEAFRLFFNTPVSIENFNQLPKPFQAYAKQIVEMGRYISFAIQPNQEGFGHAVYCTREILAEEPFLLLLGDHLYRSNGEKSCTRQLLDAYQQHGTSILGLRRTAEDQIANFGTVAGVWMKEDKLLNNTEFSEKPTVDYARSHLRVPGLPDGEHLTVFGQYILQPQLFDFLE